VSDSTNRSKHSRGSSVGQTSVGQDSAIKEDRRVSLSLPPLSNHGLLSSGGDGGSKDWEAIGQGVSSIASISQRVGIGDRECGGVVDERSGGSEDSGGSSQDGGLGISRSLAVVTEMTKAVISNSHRNGVSSDFVGNLGGSVNN